MTSDKQDHDDLDMDMGMDETDNSVIDVEGLDEPLTATPLGGADEYDAEGDDEYADEAEPQQKTKKKSGGMTKVVAPLLVLLIAAGAGGFIVMNPSILGGSKPSVGVPTPAPVVPATDTALLPPPDAPAAETPAPLTPEMPADMAATDVPPQPLANLNEAPPAEPVTDMAAVPEITPDTPVPEITPEQVVDATAPAPEAPPVLSDAPADAPTQDTTEVIAGSDAPVTPEAVNIATPEAPAAPTDMPTPVVAPDVTPEVVAATPEATPPTPAAEAPVTEPTFVPAPPADPNAAPVTATEASPVSVADSAVPPVMNLQEVNATAPEMPPRTVTQPTAAPATTAGASGGTVAAAPAPNAPAQAASNVYYDSLSQVPVGAMATSVGPREVNPVMEPAQKMIVVSKDRNESSEESLLISANRALKLKRYDAALEMFDQLYAKNKRDVRILMGRAVAQQNMGLNESAIQSYEEVLTLKPNNTDAVINMMGLVRKQYPEVALRRLLDLYSKYPSNAGIAAQIGVTNAELGHFDDAMRYLGIASTLEPNNAQHWFNMGIAADRGGSTAEAIKMYERALEVDVMYGASRSIPRERIYDRLSVLRRG